MKPISALIIFALLVASAVAAGIDSILRTKNLAEADVEHALAMTLVSCEPDRIDADTIRVYRDNISLDFLRDTAYIAMTFADEDGRRQPTLTAHTGLTPLQLWQLSDQRASGLLTLLAALWLAFSMGLSPLAANAKNAHSTEESVAENIRFAGESSAINVHSTEEPSVENAHSTAISQSATIIAPTLTGNEPGTQAALSTLHLTPMQRELMEMFLATPGHRLLRQDICDRLWPKKPDASATLYTLIRRIKPTLAKAGMNIECERGQAYRLTTVDIPT